MSASNIIPKSIQQRADEARAKLAVTSTVKVIQLPVWPEPARGVPNGILRSALFGVVRRGARRYLERAEIPAVEGVSIIYTGLRLDQCDLDVWETVLHVARLQNLGNECRVNAYQLLKLLGKADDGRARATLDKQLSRLNATAINIGVGRYSYEGSLIEEVYRDSVTRAYMIRLNPKLRALFEADQWTAIDWEIRHRLAGSPLAQWVHGFYSSHASPYPIKVETLRLLCGSENKDLFGFRRDLKKALAAVELAYKERGLKFQTAIEDDLVIIGKSPSRSQLKHLSKKNSDSPKTSS
jgi:hypothetical protein